MKFRIRMAICFMMCISMGLSAMVIHNYTEEKDESTKIERERFNEDYLYLGHGLDFSGESEDLVFLGKTLTFTGKTKLGLIALCEKLNYAGYSGNGIIGGAKNITVNGIINSTSYVGCKSFVLGDTATINGNLFIGCATVTINGRINGDLFAGAGEIVINNEIRGNVTAYAGRIILGEKGKITGNLVYTTKEKLSGQELTKVTGTVTFKEKVKHDKDWAAFVKFMAVLKYLICLALFISFVIVGSLLLFFPVFRSLDPPQSSKTFWRTSLWGLIPVLIYPAVIVLGFVMVVTIPFSLVLMLGFIPLFYVANIIGSTLLGKYLAAKLHWKTEKRHFHFLIGATASGILSLIPFVNCLGILFVSALGWGVYVSFLFKKDLSASDTEILPPAVDTKH